MVKFFLVMFFLGVKKVVFFLVKESYLDRKLYLLVEADLVLVAEGHLLVLEYVLVQGLNMDCKVLMVQDVHSIQHMDCDREEGIRAFLLEVHNIRQHRD